MHAPSNSPSIRCLLLGIFLLYGSSNRIIGAEQSGHYKSTSALPALRFLNIEPSPILLSGFNRQQQLLVTGVDASGNQLDLTPLCRFQIADSNLAQVQGTVIKATAEGGTTLRVQVGNQETTVPVRVVDFAAYPPIHFGNDIIPVFSKLGCNSAGCHGKASGQNGFRLSIFGFDPAADYGALVKESRGRRVFPASPANSLLLLKPLGQVAHGGGRRIDPGSADHELLVEWIKQGMPWGKDDAPHAVALHVNPAERTLGPQADQQILVTALYSDGRARDVTAAATYISNATTVAEAEKNGMIRTGKLPGEAAITVRYLDLVSVVGVQVPRTAPIDSYPPSPFPIQNRIDELVLAKWKKMGIVPSGLADDAAFLRRASIDLLGTLPKPEEVRAFLADSQTDKRNRLIERLLERSEYADYWALKWADILLVNQDKLGDRGALEFHRWLRRQFAANRPYDEWVRELVTASGGSRQHGPVNFYRVAQTPEDAAKAISQAFLGVRLECAQCHHHPFEKWSQDDFYGLAGFFNGMQKRASKGEDWVYFAGYRETRIPHSNKLAATHAPDGPVPTDLKDGDPRTRLAEWMTAPDNPFFARLVANRLWKHYFGRGLVEPEDDLRSTNPATNEELLAYLAQQFVALKFDLKAMSRLLLQSRVYQLASVPNASNRDDEQNFSRHYVRRLPAEVLLDAICAVTEIPEKFPGKPRGTRAIELWDNRFPSYFLEIFGRSERTSPCECGRSGEPTMAQALHLMNAPEVEDKISNANGRIARLLRAPAPTAQIVEELCLAALGRSPAEKERNAAKQLFAQAPPAEAARDFLWTLLNSYDFLFNP